MDGTHAFSNPVYKVNFCTMKVLLPLAFIMKLKMCPSGRKKKKKNGLRDVSPEPRI